MTGLLSLAWSRPHAVIWSSDFCSGIILFRPVWYAEETTDEERTIAPRWDYESDGGLILCK